MERRELTNEHLRAFLLIFSVNYHQTKNNNIARDHQNQKPREKSRGRSHRDHDEESNDPFQVGPGVRRGRSRPLPEMRRDEGHRGEKEG